MNLVKNARDLALVAHQGQTRKGSGVPYFTHPEAVAQLLEATGESKAVVAAAYLHDVLEDTDESIDHFPADVVTIVTKLTHKGGYKNSKVDAVMKLEGDRDAIVIKLADRLHNFSDVSDTRDEYARRKSVREATDILLALAIDVGLAGHPVFNRLRAKTKELEEDNNGNV